MNQRLSVKWAGVHSDGKGDEHCDWTTADLIWPLFRALEQVPGGTQMPDTKHAQGHSAAPLLT